MPSAQPSSSDNNNGINNNGNNNNGNNGFTARWQFMVSAATVMIGVGGALLSLLVNVNTLTTSVANLSSRVTSIETELSATQDRRASLATEIAAIQRDLVEVETQFCAEDAMRNLMHANDLRMLGLLWQKTMDAELPTSNAYYPAIGRCAVSGR
jgi:hypothetical protein